MPSRRTAGWIVAIYFLLMTAAVVYPGLTLANRIRPFILGIPVVFAWYLAWVAGALVVLVIYHRAHRT